jgi:hypothetical protein
LRITVCEELQSYSFGKHEKIMLISYSLWPVPRPGFEARYLSNAGKVFEVFCSVVRQMRTNSVDQIAS